MDKKKKEKSASFPTIGSILHSFADISGLTEQKYDPKRSLRKKLQRLSAERKGEIDVEEYFEVLKIILQKYEDVADHLEYHWLSGAGLFHIFKSYQELVLSVPVSELSQNSIDILVAFSFLCWSTEGYAKWIRAYQNVACQYTEPYWLSFNSQPKNMLTEILSNLKYQLTLKGCSNYALCKYLLDDSKSHEEVNDLQKQIKDWREGKTIPQWQTLEAKIISKIEAKNLEAAAILRTDLLSHFWFKHWYSILEESNVDLKRLSMLLSSRFNKSLNESEKIPSKIPSPFIWESERFIPWIEKLTQDIFEHFLPNDEKNQWQEEMGIDLLIGIKPLSEIPTDALLSVLNFFQNRRGYEFRQLISHAFEYYKTADNEIFKEIHRKMYLHGILMSAYRETSSWRSLQQESTMNPIPFLSLITKENTNWIHSWNDININKQRPYGRYNRTRLMIAAILGDFELISKLLSDGADPCCLSEDNKHAQGDKASALLLFLQRYQALGKKRLIERRILEILFVALRAYPQEQIRNMVNSRTNITAISCINTALYIGEIWIINELILLGTDLNAPCDGDDFTPIYRTVCIYMQVFDQSIFPKQSKIQNSNPLRMTSTNEAIAFSQRGLNNKMDELEKNQGIQRAFKKVLDIQKKQLPESPTEVLKILTELVNAGADPNIMNSKGWYPLDMAIEINHYPLLKLMNELGARKKAVF